MADQNCQLTPPETMHDQTRVCTPFLVFLALGKSVEHRPRKTAMRVPSGGRALGERDRPILQPRAIRARSIDERAGTDLSKHRTDHH